VSTYRIAYGRGFLPVTLPAGMSGTLVTSRRLPTLREPAMAIRQSLAFPVAGPRLERLARPGMRVVIAVTDATRACPDYLLVPALLEELDNAGVHEETVTVLFANGLHRPTTPEEKRAKLGALTLGRVDALDHNAQYAGGLVDLGQTAGGVPIVVNREVFEADLVLATGLVEPHQYAGFSGGYKTVGVGCAGEKTITVLHGPAMVEHPRVRLGQLDGNPFQEAVQEIGQRAGLRLAINVVLNDDGRIVAVASGEPGGVHRHLVEKARALYLAPVPHRYDIVIAGIGAPKDVNLYQASRAATYLALGPQPLLNPGGVIILAAETPEGAGQGAGEQRFYLALRDATSLTDFLAECRRNGYPGGQQRAFLLAKVLAAHPIIVVGSRTPEIVRDIKMLPAASIEEAIRLALERVQQPRAQTLIVPHALLTLPVVRE